MPDIFEDLDDVWTAFLYLSPYRESGMGLGMISPDSIRLYLETFGTDDPVRFWRYLRALDVAYVGAYHTDQVYVPDRDAVDDELLAQSIKAFFGAQQEKTK